MPIQNKRNKPFRILLVVLGLLSVLLGIIGIAVPILPTTPFFLLATYFFLQSSQRLYRWLLTNKFLGSYIRNYIHFRAINLWVKIFTFTLLWGTISFSIYLLRETVWAQILLAIVAIGVSVHILRLRTMKSVSNSPNAINDSDVEIKKAV